MRFLNFKEALPYVDMLFSYLNDKVRQLIKEKIKRTQNESFFLYLGSILRPLPSNTSTPNKNPKSYAIPLFTAE